MYLQKKTRYPYTWVDTVTKLGCPSLPHNVPTIKCFLYERIHKLDRDTLMEIYTIMHTLLND